MSSVSAQREAADSGGDLVSERTPRPIEWLLYAGDRWRVTVALLTAVGAAIGGLVASGAVGVTDADVVTRSLGAFVGGNLTLITIVISINQLILSREFTTPADLHDQIREVIEYRQEVAHLVDSGVSPATPGAFLDFLVTMLREETVPLRDEVADLDDDALRADVDEFADAVLSEVERIAAALEDPSRGRFATLIVVLDADFAADLYRIRRIRAAGGESLPPTVDDRLAEIVDLIEHIGVARQYVKILYYQRELAALSRKILYVGIPALGLLLATMWVYAGDAGPTVTGAPLAALVAATGTLAFAPLAVFFAYVLRVATLTRRTASLVPFTIQEDSPL